jgi:multidrug resistance protein
MRQDESVRMSRTKRAPLLFMALTIFIDFAGFGLILPLLPFWAQRLGAGPVAIGLTLAVYALALVLFMPMVGTLSDRFGRKPVIIGSLLIEVASHALTALAGSLSMLLIARFTGGLGASNIGTAQAVVSDVTTAQDRAKGMGWMGAAIGLGFVVGPAVGGVLAPLCVALPFWAAMVVALVNALLVMRFLPETHRPQAGEPIPSSGSPGTKLVFAGWRYAMRRPAIARLVLIHLLFTVAFTAMETIFPLFSQHTFGWTASQNGYVFTFVGVIVVLMHGGLVAQLVKRWGVQRVLIAGLTILAIGLISLAFSTHLGVLVMTLGIVSMGDGTVTPTVSTLLSFASWSEAQGETLGFAQGVAGLGRIIGSLAAGSAYAIDSPGAPFVAGGLLAALAILLALPALPVHGSTLAHANPRHDH